jgi:flagellar basal-body rod protein FlgB
MTAMFGAVDLGRRTLDYHLERHNVLASNVANLETPGFVPHELLRAPEAAEGAHLRATHANHLGGGGADGASWTDATETVVSPGNDGNAVSLERELSRVAANHLRYEGVARLVQMHIGALRYAASDGQGG